MKKMNILTDEEIHGEKRMAKSFYRNENDVLEEGLINLHIGNLERDPAALDPGAQQHASPMITTKALQESALALNIKDQVQKPTSIKVTDRKVPNQLALGSNLFSLHESNSPKISST